MLTDLIDKLLGRYAEGRVIQVSDKARPNYTLIKTNAGYLQVDGISNVSVNDEIKSVKIDDYNLYKNIIYLS